MSDFRYGSNSAGSSTSALNRFSHNNGHRRLGSRPQAFMSSSPSPHVSRRFLGELFATLKSGGVPNSAAHPFACAGLASSHAENGLSERRGPQGIESRVDVPPKLWR